MILIGIFVLGFSWVLGINLLGAWMAKQSGVDYMLWLPVTLLGYATYGMMISAAQVTESLVVLAGVVGGTESFVGSLLAFRMGVFPPEFSDQATVIKLSAVVAPFVALIAIFVARMGAAFWGAI